MTGLIFSFLSITLTLLAVSIPMTVTIFLGFCLLSIITTDGLELYYTFIRRTTPRPLSKSSNPQLPFVSVVVPIHSEPAGIVIKTIKALATLDYPNYEVLIVDNNTADPALWKPVEQYCRNLSHITFYHVTNLTGYKAGAINWARQKFHKQSQYLAIIDADYLVASHFLTTAVKQLDTLDKSVAFIQYPQAYYNITPEKRGIALEYDRFFSLFMSTANRYNCATSTGTLTAYKLEALDRVGLFSPHQITEDADVTLALMLAGYHGYYSAEILGRGLMPYDISSYTAQKERWGYGNAVVLREKIWTVLFSSHLSIGQKIGVISLLSAWLNNTLPALALLVSLTFISLSHIQIVPTLVTGVVIANIGILIHFALKLLSFLFTPNQSIGQSLRGFIVHWGMNWVYATNLYRALLGIPLVFNRTSKTFQTGADSFFRVTHMSLFILVIMMAFYNAIIGQLLTASALFISSMSFLFLSYIADSLSPQKGGAYNAVNRSIKLSHEGRTT